MRFTPIATAVSLTLAATSSLAQQPAAPAAPVEVTLTRMECGTPRPPADVNLRFNDTLAHPNLVLQLVFTCYLIKHGDDYMLWDTGFGPDSGATAPKVALADQLAKVGVKPEQVKFIGISHFHPDHTSGAAAFPGATLLIGKGDWDILTMPAPPQGVQTAPLKHWIGGGGKVVPIALDHDVFGDGTVTILATPGHTAGHHSVMVKLAKMGPVILSGDAAHFRENYETNGVPSFNVDRAQTLASLDRIKKLVANLKATFVIQHDPRDAAKLPAYPEAAR